MKELILIFTLSILGFSSHAQSLDDLSYGTDSTLEVMTWNLEWFPKNGLNTLDSVRKIIEALDVDIIACQEITDTTLLKQMIDSLVDYEVYFESAWFAGLAYIYKTDSVQILDMYEIYTTSPYWNAFPRSPMVMEFNFRGEPFVIINNHYKCCGDGTLEPGNTSDEEYRRYLANSLLKDYIDLNFANSRVMVVGDLNDILTDPTTDNVFTPFLDNPDHFVFADQLIAEGNSLNWSFAGWPSHLDHILITNELFDELSNSGSDIQTIKIDDFLVSGLSEYDFNISDHRPVAIKLQINKTYVDIEKPLENTFFELFPNPSYSYVQLTFAQNEKKGIIQLLDSNGKIVSLSEKPIDQYQILVDLSTIPDGTYYIRFIKSDNSVLIQKLIIVNN